MAANKGVDSPVPVLIKDMLTGRTRLNDKDLVDNLDGMVRDASKNGAVAGAKVLATRPDAKSTLGKIDVPALVIVGVEDTIYPIKMAKDMQKAIPNAQLAMIDGAAHAAVIEKPEQVNKAIMDWAGQIGK